MEKTELSILEKSAKELLDEYDQLPSANDMTKTQAIQLISRECKLVSDEKKRLFDEEIQTKRYELEKDKLYTSQKLDENRFNLEKERFNYEKERSQREYDMALRKLELDEKIFATNEANKRKDKLINLALDIARVAIPAGISLISTVVYVKFMKQCMTITYIDNGLVPKPVTDAVNRFDKFTKI